jgi:putative oxidoreductase
LLFSTFPRGWPGTGLLLMRLVAGFTLADQGIIGLRGEPRLGRVIVSVLATTAGILLIAGLWTPIAGALAAGVELWCGFSPPVDPLTHVLLGTLGAAVALVGPGGWSVDARLFGWKRINIRNRKSHREHP